MVARPAQHDALYKKWLGWLDLVVGDVTSLVVDRMIWREVRDMAVAARPPEIDFFLSWLAELYGNSLSVGVRRQADCNGRVVTLARLLEGMARNSQVLQWDRFYRKWLPADETLTMVARRVFSTWAGDEVAIPRKALESELVELRGGRLRRASSFVTGRVCPQLADRTRRQVEQAGPLLPDGVRELGNRRSLTSFESTDNIRFAMI